MSVVLQTGVMYYRESQSDDWHPLILKVDTDLSALIEDYSQKAWVLGEYCRYDSLIYRCTTPITTPEVWDSTHWQETTIGEELKSLADITGDGDLDSGFTASDLTGAANELLDIIGDGSLSGFTATDLTGAANELKTALNKKVNATGNVSRVDVGVNAPGTTWYSQLLKTAGDYLQPQFSADRLWFLTNAGGSASWVTEWSIYPNELGNTVSSDLNTVTTGRMQVFLYNSNTLHSPYKEGITTTSVGIVMSYANSSNSATQFAMTTGGQDIYTRKKSAGTWGSWVTFRTSDVRILSSGMNMNNLYKSSDTGLWYIQNNVTNAPTSWAMCQVMNDYEENSSQVVFDSSTIYTRKRAGTPRQWSSWYKYTGTVVS